jgi:predicted naringenin-chalcone synthase
MAWELSSSGFRMTLSAYIADLIGEDFNELVTRALEEKKLTKSDITQWCIHPGGRKILEAIHESIGFSNGQLEHCHAILKDFGNMSSATILFVLKRILDTMDSDRRQRIFGAAFGPGLTMETFILST